MREHDLDAVLSPSFAFGSSAPAVAGYPIISVPVGLAADGKPARVWLYAGFMQAPQLLRISYPIEQLLQPHAPPPFLGSIPPEPPDAGICEALPATEQVRAQGVEEAARTAVPTHPRTGRPIPVGR
jgi:hypothetical protein